MRRGLREDGRRIGVRGDSHFDHRRRRNGLPLVGVDDKRLILNVGGVRDAIQIVVQKIVGRGAQTLAGENLLQSCA